MVDTRMETDDRINLLARVARSPGAAKASTGSTSILTLAAQSYGAKVSDDSTVPTGFDPGAARLFEAIVEGAYLVASADGVIDASERATFERVVAAACGGIVTDEQVTALVADLADELAEDGLDARVKAVAERAPKRPQGEEVLRIAALLAQASENVSAVERDVLNKLAAACNLDAAAVDAALDDVGRALSQSN
jgi:tellurite resistance protein